VIASLRLIFPWIVGLVASLLLLPFIIPVAIYQKIRGIETAPTAEDMAKALRQILANPEIQEAWEELDYEACKEPQLEAIRKEALAVPIPVDAQGLERVAELLARAEALCKPASLVREV
jgi:hypothetical protein